MTLRTLNYGKYGIFLIMGHAGFCPSTVLKGSTRVATRGIMGIEHRGRNLSQFLRIGFWGPTIPYFIERTPKK